MNSKSNLMLHSALMKPCKGRIAPARIVRLKLAQHTAYGYDMYWHRLSLHLADTYANFKDRPQYTLRERFMM